MIISYDVEIEQFYILNSSKKNDTKSVASLEEKKV